MNKTVNLTTTAVAGTKSPFSMVEQHQKGVPKASVKDKVILTVETSTAERHAGMNVSYDNSFNAIKKDILKETVDKKR